MPVTGYTLNDLDLYNEYDCVVMKSMGAEGFPNRLEPTEYDWEDEDGVQIFNDEDDIMFAPRDISLKCYISATSEANFYAKLGALRSACVATGMHELVLKHNPNVFRVYYKAGSPLEMLGGWNGNQQIGTFTLPFRETQPKYTAIWKGLKGRWILDSANETLGAELWDSAASVFTSGTYAWVVIGTNTIANVGNTLEITYVDNANGAADYLRDVSDLSTDLTVGKTYKLSVDAKYTGGSAGSKLQIWDTLGGGNELYVSGNLTTSLVTYTCYFKATHATGIYLRQTGMGASNVVTIDNLSLKTVSCDDETANANDGTLCGFSASSDNGIYTTNRASESNKAIDFDGTDDYIDLGDPFQSTFRDSFSISMWVKPDDGNPASSEYFFGVDESSGNANRVWCYYDASGKIYMRYTAENSNKYAVSSSNIFSNGAESWRHLCYVVDNDRKQIDIYFDGAKLTLDSTDDGDISSITMSDYVGTYNPYVGAYNNDGTAAGHFAGAICDVRIYDRALSGEECEVLYHTYQDGTLDI